jgi:hypothetical protein
MKSNRCLKGLYAVPAISVALFASLFFVGISGSIEGSRLAFGATLQDMANNNMLITEGSFNNNNNNMSRREDKTLTDQSPYGPGQVLEIDTENKQVTIVAHRGFAPDGSMIYYIATDASIQGVANAPGILFVNKTGPVTLSGASSDLWVFTNGISGTGPMGYQASITGSNIGDTQYSPMWRINTATWKDPSAAKFLTNASEIASFASGGMLSTEIAGFVVNCPFVEVGGGAE